MPELPEVETIVRRLRAPLIGHHIRAARVYWKRSIARPSAAMFERQLPGMRIVNITRRAKYLVFELQRDETSAFMLIHLRMTGRLEITAGQRSIDKHDRVVFDLDDGKRLHFNDARKFGRVHLVADPQEVTAPLGPEPLDDTFTLALLKDMLTRRSGRLKPLLLDQKFIAGLGNIYVDEALWLARLHPLRAAHTLNRTEMQALYRSIRRALRDGIQRNGASFDWVYPAGEYQNYFRVYDRAGEPCRRCKHPIQRIVVGQRGTYFCAHCQLERG